MSSMSSGCGSSATTNVAPTSIDRCGVTIAGSPSSVPAAGGSGTLTVTAQRECSWSARAESPWISLNSTGGQGPATITYSVQPNPNAATRRAGVSVDEQRVEIAQDAAPCRYDVSTASAEVEAAGGTVAIGLTAPGGCAWSAQSAAPWVTSDPGSGQGSARIHLTASPNVAAARAATVTIGGIAVSFNQAGSLTPPPPPPTPPKPPTPPTPPTTPDCAVTLNPSSYSADAGSDDVKIRVRARSGCGWSSSSPVGWVRIKDGRSGSGDGEVRLDIEENEGAARAATVIVADQAFSVTQKESKKEKKK